MGLPAGFLFYFDVQWCDDKSVKSQKHEKGKKNEFVKKNLVK